MRTFEVVIKGTRPILFNNPAAMVGGGAKKSGGTSIPTPQEAAERSCYWTPEDIHAVLLAVSSAYKTKRLSMTPFVAGSVEVAPDLVSFGTKDFKIDTRRAVVQRQGILRSRAKLLSWGLSFTLLVDDDFPVREAGELLRQMLEEAGRRVGIGDFRPQRKGKFGKFAVTSFKERVD